MVKKQIFYKRKWPINLYLLFLMMILSLGIILIFQNFYFKILLKWLKRKDWFFLLICFFVLYGVFAWQLFWQRNILLAFGFFFFIFNSLFSCDRCVRHINEIYPFTTYFSWFPSSLVFYSSSCLAISSTLVIYFFNRSFLYFLRLYFFRSKKDFLVCLFYW